MTPAIERIVFAHRGLNRAAPENTLPAFQAAADAGATWIETDVDILSDGTVAIIHDSTLDRTTNGNGSIYPLDGDQWARLDAGAWFSPEFAGTKPPTLAELVDLMNTCGLNANIELKSHETGKAGTLRLIEAVIRQLDRLDPEREVIISSFSLLTLALFHEKAPQYPIGVLYEQGTIGADWRSVLEITGASYMHPCDEDATAERIREVTEAGYGVNVWTVNDPERASELFAQGASGVFTDVADRFIG